MNDVQINYTARQDAKIPKNFDELVQSKIVKVAKIDPSLEYDIELTVNNNPARGDSSHKVEITAVGNGKVYRAESREITFESALDDALEKLQTTVRRAKKRNQISKSGHRKPDSIGNAFILPEEENKKPENVAGQDPETLESYDPYEDEVDFYTPGSIVRVKEHESQPMSREDALGKMESLNHDFYLFFDSENDNKPSVVYRRKGFDYGLISLAV